MVVILLGNGFEDIEALAPCDILRRGGLKVMLVGVNGEVITSGRGVAVKADCTVHDVDINTVAQLVIPGGMGADMRNLKVVNEGPVNAMPSQNIDDRVYEILLDQWFGAAFVVGKVPNIGAHVIQ